MNRETTEGNRKESRGKLSNDRLEVIAAKRDQLEGEIQQAWSIIKGAAEKQDSGQGFELGFQRLSKQQVLH